METEYPDIWRTSGTEETEYTFEDVTEAERKAHPEIESLMSIREKAYEFIELTDEEEFEDEPADEYEERLLSELEESLYWDEDTGEFDEDSWTEDLNRCMSMLKVEAPAVRELEELSGYEFANENLLRQAFTTALFAREHGMQGSMEETLAFGRAVISASVLRQAAEHYTTMDISRISAPLRSTAPAEKITAACGHAANDEFLAQRCRDLGLERYIIGKEDEQIPPEDIIKALIGAVAADCGMNEDICSKFVDEILNIHFETKTETDEDYYNILNDWCAKRYNDIPEYEVFRVENGYYGKVTGFGFGGAAKGQSRSLARTNAAKAAIENIRRNGAAPGAAAQAEEGSGLFDF